MVFSMRLLKWQMNIGRVLYQHVSTACVKEHETKQKVLVTGFATP